MKNYISIKDNWKPFTLSDAYKPRTPIQYLVGQLFEIPSLNIVYGAPGTLKSFFLADLSCHVSGGIDWLSPLPDQEGKALKIHQAPVLWIDYDNGSCRTHERFAAIGRNLNLSRTTPLTYYSMPSPLLNIRDESHRDDLINLVISYGAKLIVIDNLGSISGFVDENSSEMIPVMFNLRMLTEKTSSVVVVVHHQRKSTGSSARKGETLRGHSSIEASLDLALLITREQDAESIIIEATKVRGAEVKPFGAMFAYYNDPAGELHKAGFFSSSQKVITTINTINQAIIDVLGKEIYNKTELSDLVYQSLNKTVGYNRISTSIDNLVNKEYIYMTKSDKNNAHLYSLNPQKTY